MFYFCLGILILAEGASLFLRRRSFWVVKKIAVFFAGTIILIFGWLAVQSWRQYQIWSQNEMTKFLLPPHRSIAYFLQYIFTNFFFGYLISLTAALLFLAAMIILNKRFQKRFFEDEEPFLGALAIFSVGHPLWLYDLLAIFAIGVLGTIFLRFRNKEQRFSFYYFWLPAALIIVIVGKFLV